LKSSLSSHKHTDNEFDYSDDQQEHPKQRQRLLLKSLNHIPEVIRFSMSGCLGSVLFFLLERVIHSVLTNSVSLGNESPTRNTLGFLSNETLSFLTAYFLHVIPQHWFHAVLVYGMETISTRDLYLKSLMACYST
jgi:hypothetical protein